MNGIAEYIREQAKEHYPTLPMHVEGRGESGWVLMDYGSVIVHLFAPEEREYYRLEKLWSAATPVLRMQYRACDHAHVGAA